MTGVVNDREEVISLLDGKFSDKSVVIPVERKKDGSCSANSSVISGEDYAIVSDYVSYKIKTLGREILQGSMGVNPCEQGGKNSCTYCDYKGVCGYDEEIPGYRMRTLKNLSEEELFAKMSGEVEKERQGE